VLSASRIDFDEFRISLAAFFVFFPQHLPEISLTGLCEGCIFVAGRDE
jgi:hypothetical protein